MNPYRLMAQIAVPEGSKIAVEETLCQSNDETRRAYSFKPKRTVVLAIALAMALYVAALVHLQGAGVLSSLLLVYMTCIAAIIVITDLRCLIVPWELALGLLPAATLWQISQNGWEGLFAGAAAGCGAWLLFAITDKLFYRLGKKASVGGGDRRMIAPIFLACGFPFCLYATLAACTATLAVVMILHTTGKYRISGKDTTIPFGPSLAAILLVGLAMQAA